MPYIVTTKREIGRREARRHFEIASRRAVATLEEARMVAARVVLARPDYEVSGLATYFDRASWLPESGGSVGLPNGTLIEVEPRSRHELMRELFPDTAQMSWLYSEQELLDAFNAA